MFGVWGLSGSGVQEALGCGAEVGFIELVLCVCLFGVQKLQERLASHGVISSSSAFTPAAH